MELPLPLVHIAQGLKFEGIAKVEPRAVISGIAAYSIIGGERNRRESERERESDRKENSERMKNIDIDSTSESSSQ